MSDFENSLLFQKSLDRFCDCKEAIFGIILKNKNFFNKFFIFILAIVT